MTFAAFAAALLLLIFPSKTLPAAQAALQSWARTVCPTLFPFLTLLPALTGRSACALYERRLSRGTQALFRVPGSAAAGIAVGWIAGSPAGCLALLRIAGNGRMTRGSLIRAACLSSGVSPLFVISSVGYSLLGDTALGWRLLIAQLLSLLTAGLIFRFRRRDDDAPLPPSAEQNGANDLFSAVRAVLTICGYMVDFAALGSLLPEPVRFPASLVLEIAGGTAAAASASLPLPALAGLIGFGGICILLQNLEKLRPLGVRLLDLLPVKLLHAGLCALYAHILPTPSLALPLPDSFDLSFALALGLALIACRTFFLSSRGSRGSSPA